MMTQIVSLMIEKDNVMTLRVTVKRQKVIVTSQKVTVMDTMDAVTERMRKECDITPPRISSFAISIN